MPLDRRHPHSFWASIIAETLARLGLTQAVICPGSRSGLLAVAFAQHPAIEAVPVLDERSAAFFALGLAKQSHQPVVLLCTSGTAGAHFYPAVIEASESSIPLLILTADRPPELRHCHSGQTIDQLKLFGTYPRWQAELALPDANPLQWRYLRQTILQAWLRARFPTSGVVHLNCPFRDPLYPVLDFDFQAQVEDLEEEGFFYGISHGITFAEPNLVDPFSSLRTWQKESRCLIIAGIANPTDPVAYCRAIATLAQFLQAPVLADALSPLRNFAHLNPHLVSTYDLILRDRRHCESLVPNVVVQIGDFPTSKELRAWLTELESPCWLIDDRPDNFDPLHLHSYRLAVSVTAFVQPLLELTLPRLPTPDPYLKQWLSLEVSLQTLIDQRFETVTSFLEAKIARLLSQHLPPHSQLVIANSMPVRYMEWFWQPSDRQIIPYCNRGTNGIDGTLSTAIGIAHRCVKTMLLTGDLALLHDSNGFLLNSHFQGHLTIILIDNRGGGIFELLPIAHFDPPFEDFFAMPQRVDFAQLAQGYGIKTTQIHSWQQFIALIQDLPDQGIRLLQINCDRKRDAQWLKDNLPNFSQRV
jgi:2-succinyl-5-enolpyruvyl-6-hydroxy-3-cyclohexene-1-carboxylate synthase